jgi:hypothetical protein
VDLITFEKNGIIYSLTHGNDVLLWISTLKNKIMKLTLKKELPLIELYYSFRLFGCYLEYVTGESLYKYKELINEINILIALLFLPVLTYVLLLVSLKLIRKENRTDGRDQLKYWFCSCRLSFYYLYSIGKSIHIKSKWFSFHGGLFITL